MDRGKTVINLYAAGHPIDEIWKASGFRSRSSVFRILNKYGVKQNRGKHSGPIKKKGERNDGQNNEGTDVHFHARFLAMPKLMQAWFWSFGLTKTFNKKKTKQ